MAGTSKSKLFKQSEYVTKIHSIVLINLKQNVIFQIRVWRTNGHTVHWCWSPAWNLKYSILDCYFTVYAYFWYTWLSGISLNISVDLSVSVIQICFLFSQSRRSSTLTRLFRWLWTNSFVCSGSAGIISTNHFLFDLVVQLPWLTRLIIVSIFTFNTVEQL